MANLAIKKGLLFIVMLVSLSACAQHPKPTYAVYKDYADINIEGMDEQILFYINEYRSSIGKGALKMIEVATDEATDHSIDMAKHANAFGHAGFEKRINTVTKKIGNITSAAENVAYGKLTAKEVVDGWLHSAGHKKNIEGDYNLTGIGIAKSRDGLVYYTQIFLNK